VRIITTGESDVFVAKFASEYLIQRLIKGGVRVYQMQSKVLHAKTAIIDDTHAFLGSFNLDRVSLGNDEVVVCTADPELNAQLVAQWERDMAICKVAVSEATAPWIKRLANKFSYWFLTVPWAGVF
jgi:cardiolipin synthase A/B